LVERFVWGIVVNFTLFITAQNANCSCQGATTMLVCCWWPPNQRQHLARRRIGIVGPEKRVKPAKMGWGATIIINACGLHLIACQFVSRWPHEHTRP